MEKLTRKIMNERLKAEGIDSVKVLDVKRTGNLLPVRYLNKAGKPVVKLFDLSDPAHTALSHRYRIDY